MKLKVIQIILEGLKMVFISFVISLIFLFVDSDNTLHVILSFPIFLGVLYIGIEGLPKSNKLNKEKEVN